MDMRPLNRSIFLACVIFFLLLSLVLSWATYHIYATAMYGRYQKQMASILDYVEAHIDNDDMAECAKTYVESDTYKEFQAFFDELIDHYKDVHYLYIMQVLPAGSPAEIVEICAANSTYEKLYDPDMVMHLGDAEEGWYTAETAQEFRNILEGDQDAFVLNQSEWGIDYTLARPLINSAGEHYGLLCADVSVDELNTVVYRNININITIIIASAVLFTVLLLIWIHYTVISPIKRLEESVATFAKVSTGKRDPNELVFTPPEIRTRNEVYSLSQTMVKLSEDMRDYVKGLVEAEDENMDLQAHVTEMNAIAYQDALTKVKNKAAYDQKKEELKEEIANNTAQFAMVMVDLNGLKEINDRYGHENGNTYIVSASDMVCQVFKHSPVYRVGGDEFVVVVQDKDYQEKDRLVNELKKRFAESVERKSADPWRRCSAAVGMAVYQAGDDVDKVFNRADQEMYRVKAAMKAEKK